jgi:hypothetical protein
MSAKDNIRHLKFIAREGYVLNQAFENIRNHPRIKASKMILPEGAYFLCSRRAAIFAALTTKKDISRLLEKHYHATLREFFEKRLNISDMEAIESGLGETALERVVSLPRDYKFISEKINMVFGVLLEQAEKERRAFLKYCAEQEINGSEKVGLVDVGYSGSIQKAITKLLGHPIAGYYFVTDKYAAQLSSSKSICRGYFGEYIDPIKNNVSIYRHSLLLEAVLTAPSGQLLYFKEDQDGIEPIYKEPGVSQREFVGIRLIQEGILKFTVDMIDLFGVKGFDIEFPKDVVQRCYEMIVTGELGIGDLKSLLSVEDDFCGNNEISVMDFYNNAR